MKKQYIQYLVALLLFGANGIVASHITLNSYETVFFRTLLGSLFLLSLFAFGKKKLTFYKHGKSMVYLMVSGIALGGTWMFLYEAYVYLGVSIATLACYCGPVIVMAASPIVFKETLNKNMVFGFICVLIGLFFVTGKIAAAGNIKTGLLCGGGSAVMYAVMILCSKKSAPVRGLENAALQLFFSFLTVAVFVAFKQGYHFSLQSSDILPLLVLGLVNTGIGCYLYFSSIGSLNIQSVSILGYLEPLSAVIFSGIFLHEKLMPLQVAGSILIIGGAMYGEFKKQKRPTIAAGKTPQPNGARNLY